MTDQELREYIDLTVKKSIEEFKRNGIVKGSDNAAYSDISEILRNYFKGEKQDKEIGFALQRMRFDPYFRIITMYYEDGQTIEQIAEIIGADTSTIMRNKKRLCLQIYNEIV